MGPISGLDFGRHRYETNSPFRAGGAQIVDQNAGPLSGPSGGPILGSWWPLLGPRRWSRGTTWAAWKEAPGFKRKTPTRPQKTAQKHRLPGPFLGPFSGPSFGAFSFGGNKNVARFPGPFLGPRKSKSGPPPRSPNPSPLLPLPPPPLPLLPPAQPPPPPLPARRFFGGRPRFWAQILGHKMGPATERN